jgi:Family of unknown function (DUF6238)
MLPPDPPDPRSNFMAFATASIDLHRALNPEPGATVPTRSELDALHCHLISLCSLLETHTTQPQPPTEATRKHLRAARIRLWQAADHLHRAYHTLARDEARTGSAGRAVGGRLTVCQRHLRTTTRLRRDTSPAELHAPFTGRIN